MKKMRADRPSKIQQSDLGMESNGSGALDVTMTGAVCTTGVGRMISGCVFVMFTAGLGTATGFGRTAMRAVSFFGPGEIPAKFPGAGALTRGAGSGATGFGSGWRTGEVETCGACTGGRRNEVIGDSAAGSAPVAGEGFIVGGNRRGGTTGVREGRTILAVSFAPPFCGSCLASGLGGSAMRTVSFFGSAMANQVAPGKIAEIPFFVTR
jgi:hypothetical protein